MRLDHLLSKESLALQAAYARLGVHCSLVERWLFSCRHQGGPASRLPLSRGAERGPAGGRGLGTLLGPEGAAAPVGVLFLLHGLAGLFSRMRGRAAGFRPFLENCTVDASISCFFAKRNRRFVVYS